MSGLVAGFRHNNFKLLRSVPQAAAMVALKDMVDSGSETIVVLDPRTRSIAKSLDDLVSTRGYQQGSKLVLVLPWQPAPLDGLRSDKSEIRSFCVSGSVVRKALLGSDPLSDIQFACYMLLSGIASLQLNSLSVVVKQVGRRQPGSVTQKPACTYTIIMAHRGSREHLEVALSQITDLNTQAKHILVGLDISDTCEYSKLIDKYSNIEFYKIAPAPSGPYVLRSELIKLARRSCNTREGFILFHDSDDFSCSDRVEKLHSAFDEQGVGLVGSHEVRLEEMTRQVIAVRYPLDVTSALPLGVGHPQLHPSTMIRSDVYEAVGGFSTHSKFGNDTQFLMRAYFRTAIRNVDEFLYVRRKHPSALTVSADTCHGSSARIRIEAPWQSDFPKILARKLSLEDSQLRRFESDTIFHLERLLPSGVMLRSS